jgi:hypothetical protein
MMDTAFRQKFIQKWSRYFPGAELPIGFYYSHTAEPRSVPPLPKGHRCMVADLLKVRKGKTISFDHRTVGCFGGKRYLGFDGKLMPHFEYFLSYGIPGKLEGERYKKNPELVQEFMKQQKPWKAPGDYIVFKRWDHMQDGDRPLVVIFYAPPDVLSGLFTLANFDESQPHGVIAPFCAGCASIVGYPYKELESDEPRAVLGMFDVSARPCVPSGILTFAVPWPKFERMVHNFEESFLITKSWNKLRTRMKRERACPVAD